MARTSLTTSDSKILLRLTRSGVFETMSEVRSRSVHPNLLAHRRLAKVALHKDEVMVCL